MSAMFPSKIGASAVEPGVLTQLQYN